MAMYEERGYCPYNELTRFDVKEKVSDKWDMTRNILKDRLLYMVYPKGSQAFKGAYIIDVLKYQTGVLGLHIACTLANFVSVCQYPKPGKPIICMDVINPYQIPVNLQEKNGEWTLEPEENLAMHQDETYLVVIQKKEEEVHIYFFQK